MSHGRNELALLDVDGAAGLRGGDQQVSLAAEERGNLQHGFDIAQRIGEPRAVLRRMHVGQDRQTGIFAIARRMRAPSTSPARESCGCWCDSPCRSWP
jgi:hypothetical protein